MMHRREIEGISGWELIAPLVCHLPDETMTMLNGCESPIEQLFASALSLLLHGMPADERPSLTIQVPIAGYRADIVLTGRYGAPRIVVECDGAAFHTDKARDAKRTAVIEQNGYRVVRVTGSEIHHNPLSRAKSLLREVGML